MAEKIKKFEGADAIYMACVFGIVSIVVTFCQDYLDILTFIPGWILDVLKTLGWCIIFGCVGIYCKDRFNYRTKLFTVLIVFQIIMFVDGLFSVSIGPASFSYSSAVPVLGTIMTLLEIGLYGSMLAVGVKMSKFKMSKLVPVAFIIFGVFGILGGVVDLFADDKTSFLFTIVYTIILMVVELVVLLLIRHYFEHTALNELKYNTLDVDENESSIEATPDNNTNE